MLPAHQFHDCSWGWIRLWCGCCQCVALFYTERHPTNEPKWNFFQWRVRDSPNLILHLNPKAKGRTLVVGTAPFFFRTSSPVISRVDVIVDRETDLDNWHCCQGWCNLSSPVTFTRNAPETFGKIRFLSILKNARPCSQDADFTVVILMISFVSKFDKNWLNFENICNIPPFSIKCVGLVIFFKKWNFTFFDKPSRDDDAASLVVDIVIFMIYKICIQ